MEQVSVIVSVYNEEQGLEQFYRETKGWLEKLPGDYEILFVDDGSSDGSGEILRRLAEEDRDHVRVIAFSREAGLEVNIEEHDDPFLYDLYEDGDYVPSDDEIIAAVEEYLDD